MQPVRAPAQRSTEGTRESAPASMGKSGQVKRGRGRPPGQKNKPKSLVPAELANEMLIRLEGTVPKEHFAYLKGVVKGGKAISTKQELDVLILLLNRNIWPALMEETDGQEVLEFDEDGSVLGSKKQTVFRKDVTDRLKVLQSLLNLRATIERREEDAAADEESPILKIWAARGMQDRVAILLNPPTPAAIEAGETVDGTAVEVENGREPVDDQPV